MRCIDECSISTNRKHECCSIRQTMLTQFSPIKQFMGNSGLIKKLNDRVKGPLMFCIVLYQLTISLSECSGFSFITVTIQIKSAFFENQCDFSHCAYLIIAIYRSRYMKFPS